MLIEQLTADKLHGNWEFIRRGAQGVLRKVGLHTDWIPEDLYAALRYPDASHTVCWVVSRNQKALGWIAGELQRDRYGGLEFFIWTAWDIPLGERLPEDDVEGARDQLLEFIKLWARTQNCKRVTCLSSRQLEHLGWVRGHTVFYIPL